MSQRIEITISSAGETKVETQGFAGNSCQQASRLIEETLGARISEKLTPEFYATSQAQQQLREGR